MQHGEFGPYLAEIGMEPRTAQRFMAIGDGIQIRQLVAFASVDEALKSLPPKRSGRKMRHHRQSGEQSVTGYDGSVDVPHVRRRRP